MLLVEEGQPDYIEQNLNAILRRNGVDTALHGKDMLPVAGEYTSAAVTRGVAAFLRRSCPSAIEHEPALLRERDDPASPFAARVAAEVVQPRPPGLCTGCPERPIFSGMKLAERETGEPPRQRRHRLPPVRDQRPVRPRRDDDGLRPRVGRRRRAERPGGRQAHGGRSWVTAASGTTA